jgi:hypothetical protein
MGFTATDERAIRRQRFVYRPQPDDRASDRWLIESANELLPPVAQQVCDALRHTMAMGEELRVLVPFLSYRGMNDRARSVRLDALACTDRQVHLVFAGSDTGVDARLFAYGTLDADTKLTKFAPELTEKKGRPLLIVPRLAGREAKFDQLLAAPPAARDPELDAGQADAPPPPTPAGWYPDPLGRHQVRYWDGAAWTANAATNGVSVQDPVA